MAHRILKQYPSNRKLYCPNVINPDYDMRQFTPQVLHAGVVEFNNVPMLPSSLTKAKLIKGFCKRLPSESKTRRSVLYAVVWSSIPEGGDGSCCLNDPSRPPLSTVQVY
ncbi:hypothetical protein AVEN_146217-1 [Araneus ventricosus]|uniref:Uncharacterized protein n=1 Tax=Araneus ventricosus TaxID=182803 RepID=A0A4Y2CIT0_ARAVE|nr:hypothetical protein AVEN_146217-1 [Araneus ventricosus]